MKAIPPLELVCHKMENWRLRFASSNVFDANLIFRLRVRVQLDIIRIADLMSGQIGNRKLYLHRYNAASGKVIGLLQGKGLIQMRPPLLAASPWVATSSMA